MRSRAQVKAWLESRFWLRIHMTLIIAATVATGVLSTRAMGALDVDTMAVRYGIAVVVAWLAFLLLIRVWLWYIGFRARSVDLSADGVDVDFVRIGQFWPSAPARTGDALSGGGGNFGGGGATGAWGSGDSSSSSGSAGGFSLDLGDDLGAIVLVILVAVAAVMVAGAGLYFIVAAPAVLSEIAFEALLAASLLPRMRKMARRGDWLGAVWRKTVWPFLGILALAIAIGWWAQHICPAARTLPDAVDCRTPAQHSALSTQHFPSAIFRDA